MFVGALSLCSEYMNYACVRGGVFMLFLKTPVHVIHKKKEKKNWYRKELKVYESVLESEREKPYIVTLMLRFP